MAKHLTLTDAEAEFVCEVLEWWEDGYGEAESDTIADSGLEMGQLLTLTSMISEQVRMCKFIQLKLKGGQNERGDIASAV